MANTKDDLLALFADNTTNDITAARLRQFVEDVYNQMVLLDDVVDDLTSDQETAKPLSASRGAWLQTQIDTINATLSALDARITALEP